jgi:hypothetical protein
MALFRTTAEVKQYIAIDVNMKFNTIKPALEDAEENFIKPLLGNAFYTAFAADYAGALVVPTNLTVNNQALLPFIQRALAFYAAFYMIDEVGVNVGDLGVQQQYNQNSQPAPAFKVNALKMKYITSADRAADKLLDYLEQNASATKYNEWFSDIDANTAMTGAIVYKTSIASKYIDINESRRVFLRLKKRIKDIEASYIKRLICTDQYEEVLTQLRTGSLTSINEKLVAKLEPIIAKKALYLTMPSLAISVEAEGLLMYSSNDSVVQKQIAGSEEKKLLMCNLKEGDFGYEADEEELDAFLAENIADYPLISASPCWTNRPTDGNLKYSPDNDPCNKHFSV